MKDRFELLLGDIAYFFRPKHVVHASVEGSIYGDIIYATWFKGLALRKLRFCQSNAMNRDGIVYSYQRESCR